MRPNYPLGRTDDLIIQELTDEVLIYDLKINRALCLNQTSALVWNSCDGTKSIAEITRSVGRQLRSPVKEEIVWLALERLSEQNLLTGKIDAAHLYRGISRREAVRKIGIASAVSLPLISSMTAPTAIHAQSVCGGAGTLEGCPCSSDADCDSANGTRCNESARVCELFGVEIPCPCQEFCEIGGECACDANGVSRPCPVPCDDPVLCA